MIIDTNVKKALISDKGFKAAITKVLQEVRTKSLETNGKIENLSKEIEGMKKKNEIFRIKICNNLQNGRK